MFRNILVLLVLLIGTLPITQAQQAAISENVQKNIQSRVDNRENIGIVVGVIDENGTQYYSYGVKSLETGEEVNEKSVFEIGSISKTFTGILLADMVLKKEMKLEDPIQKYLPKGVKAPKYEGDAIQLVHLSNHTSSLPRMPNNFSPANPQNPYVDYTEEQLLEFLEGYELTRAIGSQYEYSNLAQGLLGHILAAKRNTTYEELMVEVIAEPLKMKNTRIVFTPEMEKHLAMGHSRGFQVENWDIPTLAGAGAIRSTAVDMLKYLAANMGTKKTKLYPAMQLSHQNTRTGEEKPMVGLGWHTMEFEDEEIVWHNGGTGGYRAFAGFVKDGNKGVVVLTNSDSNVDDIGVHILHPESPLREVKPPVSLKLMEVMDKEGIEAGVETYWDLQKNHPEDYDFQEGELNNLGYQYLGNNEIEKAIAVFKLNVEAYPEAFNTYDSLGEGYMIQGDKEKAIANYKKSVELNPSNRNGIEMLEKLGVETDNLIPEINIEEDVLESYVGKYQLAPGFVLTITRDGKQLKAQATGQQQFNIFPRSENVFYWKVVTAQVTFNHNDEGEVESATLLQNGNEMEGKRIED